MNGVKGFEREVFIRSFTAKDGREVRLRFPRWSGLDDMLELISSLVEEGAKITATEKKTRDEEVIGSRVPPPRWRRISGYLSRRRWMGDSPV